MAITSDSDVHMVEDMTDDFVIRGDRSRVSAERIPRAVRGMYVDGLMGC